MIILLKFHNGHYNHLLSSRPSLTTAFMSAQPVKSEGSPPTALSRANNSSASASRGSSSPGPFARPPVRRLSQLEPVHIAALNQEYRSQIREAAKAELHSDSQKEHYEKARKIQILLEKYEVMVQEKRRKQQSPGAAAAAITAGGGVTVPSAVSSPQYDMMPKLEESSSNSTPPPSLSASPPPVPSISQQMAANIPRYQYSQQNSPAAQITGQQQQQPDSGSQYSQFRVQLESNNSSGGPSGQPTPTGSPGPYYNKSAPNNIMQYQQGATEPLNLQLQRYKQLEKEAQDQLLEVERTGRETPNLDPELRAKLRQQEQNLRTKRDQYKSMALTVTQQLQSSMVKQQKLQNQKQVQKIKQQDKPKATKFATKSEVSSPKPYTPSEMDAASLQDAYQRSYNTSTNASRQASPSAASPPDYAGSYSYAQSKYSQVTMSNSPPLPSLPATLGGSGVMPSSSSSTSLNATFGSKTTPSTQYKHSALNLTKSHSIGSTGGVGGNNNNNNSNKPVRVPGKVGRPPLTSNVLSAKQQRMSASNIPGPTQQQQNAIPAVPIAENVFNKRKINELIRGLMPEDMDDSLIETEVEDIVGDLVEEFVDNITTFACRLAKHRKAEYVEAKDVYVHLERNWNIRVPGFPGDEVSIVRRTVPSKGYSSKIDMLNASKSYGGINRL